MVDMLPAGNSKGTIEKIIMVLLVVIIIVVAIKVYKSTKAVGNVVGQAIGNETISTQTGIPTPRVVYIRSQAQMLWDEGVKSTLWIRDYDEEMFISVINACTTSKEVGLLDEFYKEQSGERLRDSIRKSFKPAEKKRLNSQWVAILNS